jgi:hypothetical protein
MSTPSCRISLADLRDAGIRFRPSEAVAITLDIIRRACRGELPGIPPADAVRFSCDGSIWVDRPVPASLTIERAARLLEALLPDFDAPADCRVPGALRIVVARALRALDLPPFASLDAFAGALGRFGTDDPAAGVRSVCERWAHVVGGPVGASEPDLSIDDLTISDVRRARRSTGLTLSEIAERSRIPVSLLRELEWGYFVNWPDGHYGRVQLVRYARAAGLDEETVIRAVWPVLQEAIRTRAGVRPSAAASPHEHGRPGTLVRASVTASSQRLARNALKPRPVLAVISLAALLGAVVLPGRWNDPPLPVEPGPHTAGVIRPVSSTIGPSPVLIQEDAGFSPALAAAGSAMFDTDAVLRVTRVVDDGARSFHARLSPDGRFIAFDSDRDGQRAVYVADASGQNVRRLTGEGFAAVPAWSPDGRRLAFVRAEADRPPVWNLWLYDFERNEATRLTSHRSGRPWGAAWFPDGNRLVYGHETRLIVRSLEDGSEDVYPAPDNGRLIRTPAVSPDGQWIVFQVEQDGAWLLNLSTRSMRQILSDPSAGEFTWAPEGDKLAYHSRQSGTWSVWVMPSR